MKQLFKALVAFCLVFVMAFAMISVAAAEETAPEEETTVVSITDDGGKAYQLVWKYKTHNGHLYKRRWNKTLNEWYDPAWILVN